MLLAMGWGLALAADAVSVGPSAFLVMPGIEIGWERTAGDHAVARTAVLAETLGVAGRVGLGGGIDAVTRADGPALYIGAGLGAWSVFERSGTTLGTSLRVTGGFRSVSDSGWLVRLGLGAARPVTLAGDSSLGHRLQPAFDLDLGRVLP